MIARSFALPFSASVALLLVVASGCAESRPEVETTGPITLSGYDTRVDSLLALMTLEEKVGQMTQADQEHLDDVSDISSYFLGSLLSGGNSDPEAGNSLEAWTAMYERYQQEALSTRLAIPLLYGVDAVHGHSNVLGAVIFPHNIGLGATRNAELVEEIGRITALEVRASGINWTFAPCVTVPRDERWGRTYEGFSEDPELVAELGAAAQRGLQGDGLSDQRAVLACPKHYVGDGGTAPGTGREGGLDQGDAQIDEQTLRDVHLRPYIPALEAGAASVMPSYSSWNGRKVSGSPYLLTDVLKSELGFEGFLISDYDAIQQLDPDFKTAIEMSINAGMDMAMLSREYEAFILNLISLVDEGRVSIERIDDAVRRILRVKFAMGMMDPGARFTADPALQEVFGSASHRQVAREAVRQSLVLLKNDNATLPLSRETPVIHVAGRGADNIGMQCGGWTIRWQGEMGEVTSGGTTILEALREVSAGQVEITHSEDGSRIAGAGAAVVVIGEEPYAEYEGDDMDLTLAPEDIGTVRRVKEAGIPVVVVLLSGRPLILGEVLDLADAVVAAWLPGTEGHGVADVLFGDVAPSGKLPFTWPRSVDQLPINVGDESYHPLFPYGFGLSYEE